tara:strand:- start:855 stop:1295 length:441 start_codon:yes stop_codon:yes gene_type:complete
MLPVFELRLALPIAIDYALKNSISIFPIFSLIVLLNILVIFPIYFFLNVLHEEFMRISIYKKTYDFYIKRLQKRVDKVEEKMPKYGYLALTLFVAIPLPGTGAWTGVLVAWLLDLEKKKAIPAIMLGIIIAGLLVLFASLGIFSLF